MVNEKKNLKIQFRDHNVINQIIIRMKKKNFFFVLAIDSRMIYEKRFEGEKESEEKIDIR